MPNESTEPIRWEGEQCFFVVGSERSDDTLRIVGDDRKEDHILTLVLPTLCITYADMKFANAIGGVQKDYPGSIEYGEEFFNPPKVISGDKEIQKFTWIRGASKVTIGPKETRVEWRKFRTLVIPRLRIKAKKRAECKLIVPEITIPETQPFSTKIMQYAEGRHIGGINITKRHPNWKPEPKPQKYDLRIRVVDGKTGRPIPKASVRLYSWVTREEVGRFEFESEWHTDKKGFVDQSALPSSDKKLLIIEKAPWLPRAWRFRPLPGQKVRLLFMLWKSKRISCKEFKFPCFQPLYHVQPRDTLKRLSEYFCYKDIAELTKANKIPKPYKLYPDQEIMLPGWRFIVVPPNTEFAQLDQMAGIPEGWSRPAYKILHDDPNLAYDHEVIAVPTPKFAKTHKLCRWFNTIPKK